MMRTRAASHNGPDPIANLVRRHGAELPISDVVRSSWSRCLNAFALDPHEIRHPHSVERADLQARRERLGVLLSIARARGDPKVIKLLDEAPRGRSGA